MFGHKREENAEKRENPFFTKETFGMLIMLFSVLCVVCLLTGKLIFSDVGGFVSGFFYGLFGWTAFLYFAVLFFVGLYLVTGKSIALPEKWGRHILIAAALILTFAHTATTAAFKDLSYGMYLGKCYQVGSLGFGGSTAGGLLSGLLVYWGIRLFTPTGLYILTVAAFGLNVYAFLKRFRGQDALTSRGQVSLAPATVVSGDNAVQSENGETAGMTTEPAKPRARLFVAGNSDFSLRGKREAGGNVSLHFTDSGLTVAGFSEPTGDLSDMRSKIDYVRTPPKIDLERTLGRQAEGGVSKEIKKEQPSKWEDLLLSKRQIRDEDVVSPFGEGNGVGVESVPEQWNDADSAQKIYPPIASAKDRAEDFEDRYGTEKEQTETSKIDDAFKELFSKPEDFSVEEESEPSFKDEPDGVEKEDSFTFDVEEQTDAVSKEEKVNPVSFENVSIEKKESRVIGFTEKLKPEEKREPKETPKTVPEEEPEPINRPYLVPPLNFFEDHARGVFAGKEDHEGNLRKIEEKLDSFHYPSKGIDYIQGPSFTRYEMTIPAGIPIKKVTNFDADLMGSLEARDGVRILAPIPGKNMIGIEVANKVKVPVPLKDVLEQTMVRPTKKSALMFAIGKDLAGEAIEDNLAKGPHYLVAGSTGSGKSVCLNSMLISLIMRYSPEDLKLILVDPKTVEFRPYEHLPHLVTDEIISDPQKVLAVLDWACMEMERRYGVFRESGADVVDIEGYNENVASATVQKMPRIVIVIDELADLMQRVKRDLESKIQALTQKARSAGIHLVLATQRPSVDVITGVIKANLPSRIAFKVMTFADSMTILDGAGAEKLLGYGDMLYKNSTMPNAERYQGTLVTAKEINSVVKYIIEHNKAYFNKDAAKFLEDAVRPKVEEKSPSEGGREPAVTENDPLFSKALLFFIESGSASISMLERRFQIGFGKAGRLIDRMSELGYVSPNEGSKARRVLITMDEYNEKYGGEE